MNLGAVAGNSYRKRHEPEHPIPKKLMVKITTKGREFQRAKSSSSRNMVELQETFVNRKFAIDINTSVVDPNGFGSNFPHWQQDQESKKKKHIIKKKPRPEIVPEKKDNKFKSIEVKKSENQIGVPALFETLEPSFFYKLNDVIGHTDPAKRTNQPNTMTRTVTGTQSRKALQNAAFNIALSEVVAKSNIAKRSNSNKSKQEQKKLARSKKHGMTLQEALQALSLGEREVPLTNRVDGNSDSNDSHAIAITGKAFQPIHNILPNFKKGSSNNSFTKSTPKSPAPKNGKTTVKLISASPKIVQQTITAGGTVNNNANQNHVQVQNQIVKNISDPPIHSIIQVAQPKEKQVKKKLRFADVGRVPLETQLFGRPDPLDKVLEELNSHQTAKY